MVPVSAMAVNGKWGMRVLTTGWIILESLVCTLLPGCQVVLGLLASLPPIVLARVALSWWPGALFWQVALVCWFPTQ